MGFTTNSAIYAAEIETTFNEAFNTGSVYDAASVLEITSDTNVKPEISSIERKAVTNSYIAMSKIAGKESGAGTLAFELIPRKSDADLMGASVLEVCMGEREAPTATSGALIGQDSTGAAAKSISAYKYDNATNTNTPDAFLYTLGKPCGTTKSMSLLQVFGCTGSQQAVGYTGIVPNSVTFNFPVADVATVSFDVGASGFEVNVTVPAGVNGVNNLTETPYVGKNAVFTVDNVTYEAKDLSFTIENTVSDREALTSQGITSKEITKKLVKGSLTVTFQDYTELTKFKNNTAAQVYLEMTSGTAKFAIWIPKAVYSGVSIDDDNGILVNKIEFEAELDTNGEAIYIAHTKA